VKKEQNGRKSLEKAKIHSSKRRRRIFAYKHLILVRFFLNFLVIKYITLVKIVKYLNYCFILLKM
jgi:hypothetical protein